MRFSSTRFFSTQNIASPKDGVDWSNLGFKVSSSFFFVFRKSLFFYSLSFSLIGLNGCINQKRKVALSFFRVQFLFSFFSHSELAHYSGNAI